MDQSVSVAFPTADWILFPKIEPPVVIISRQRECQSERLHTTLYRFTFHQLQEWNEAAIGSDHRLVDCEVLLRAPRGHAEDKEVLVDKTKLTKRVSRFVKLGGVAAHECFLSVGLDETGQHEGEVRQDVPESICLH